MSAAERYAFAQREANRPVEPIRIAGIRIVLASHARYDHAGGVAAVQARSHARVLLDAVGGPPANPFVDPDGCRAWIDRAETAFRRQLAEQTAGANAPKSRSPRRRDRSN